MKKTIFLTLIPLLLLISCGYREGVIQKAEKSYIKFVGNWQNAVVEIDNAKQLKLDDIVIQKSEDGKEETISPSQRLYQTTPGKHQIKIYRNGQLVVNRILILENQATMEVFIP